MGTWRGIVNMQSAVELSAVWEMDVRIHLLGCAAKEKYDILSRVKRPAAAPCLSTRRFEWVKL